MFHKIPASKNSISNRTLIYGVGINDANYATNRRVNGKRIMCPTYMKWSRMLERSYSEKFKAKNPTYSDCYVCKEWLTFSSFAEWYERNFIDGYQLDKDIKEKGNKEYSPSKCLFVPRCINTLMLNKPSKKSNYPSGVSFCSTTKRLQVKINIDNKHVFIGRFDSVKPASDAYKKAKNSEILRKCEQYPEFAKYLNKHMYEV